MLEQKNPEDIKIVTVRPEGQRREYSNYVEISANIREISLKFCDLKPLARKEEIEEAKKEGIILPVKTEIILPYDVAESVVETLKKQLDTIREKFGKEKE